MKIKLEDKEKWIIGIFAIITILLPIFFTGGWGCVSFDSNTGFIGDTIGGTTAPFIGFFGSILVYFALKAQIDANDEIKEQFSKQETDNSNDFKYENYKERLNLIIREVNEFNISFHKNSLISNINELNQDGKKYNFIGVQAINLFLIEFFRLKKELESKNQKSAKVSETFLAIYLNIRNLIVLFHALYNDLKGSDLPENYKQNLDGFIEYIYYSKINYSIEILRQEYLDDEFRLIIDTLYDHYKIMNLTKDIE